MDSTSAVAGATGLLAGWMLRGWIPDKGETTKCHCDCHCNHAVPASESSISGALTWVAIFISACSLIAATGFAWAFKVTVTRTGEEREVALQFLPEPCKL